MNIESAIIRYFDGVLAVPVSADVPQTRPEAFVTIERVGGRLDNVVLDHASIAIQSWAGSRAEASELSEKADTAMLAFPSVLQGIVKVTRESIYNFPDPDYSMARYQGVYELVFYKEA